ncbi:2OG-Fe(II) oxygenase [Pontivivens insulae]|uniref:2OG-Fe(II) oxygenase n=1 Tax=Pontivivens insulae TaxID=1639689 RepID=A0A2R8AE17_9RHOB|nr:2OG-Fe(II) oxygenase [Pontivivens insulae]RED14407.1 hypothetical protein DFR53_1766 [Pontivivens insulae]SPF30484.1 hypothetical protein POI8812_02822 [Pontivivens insulae]
MSRAEEIRNSIIASFRAGEQREAPYRHWLIDNVLPADVAAEVAELPYEAPALEIEGGTREANNKTRKYFDADSIAKYDVAADVATALQSPEMIAAVEDIFETDLTDTYLRIEYAQDTQGFWLQPHTDIGVKKFTFLLYLSEGEGHEKLGTDIYADADTHVGASPFARNAAMIFVPADNTWHGFEPREIKGVRKSLIVNYVTKDWRAVEQLAFPGEFVKTAA